MTDDLPWLARAWGAAQRPGLRFLLETGFFMRALGRARAAEVDGRVLAPEMAALLRLDDTLQRSDLRALTPVDARARVAGEVLIVDLPGPRDVEHEDREYPSPAGPRRVRCYTPRGLSAPSPAVVYFHGGGWVTGSIGTHDGLCRRIARGASCRVLSVDYRLAPEHRFPAAADDCEAAYQWAARSSSSLGIDPARIAVAGDSAGGNLAAVVAARTEKLTHPPRLAVLLYPALDMTARFRSHETVGDKYFLTLDMCEWYYAHYMGDRDRRDPQASPLLGTVLPRVPASIHTAGFDPLRDEGKAYAERLSAEGVRCKYTEHAELIHGFALMTNVGVARRALDAVIGDVRAEL
jgi:acetyl esterase